VQRWQAAAVPAVALLLLWSAALLGAPPLQQVNIEIKQIDTK
jgi:hypothetical protein